MADNYLERKYEEWKSGKPAVRRTAPSLDSLMKKAAEDPEEDTSYKVKQAQLDAIVRSAAMLEDGVSFQSDESSSTVSCEAGSEASLGAAQLAIRLKAAELKLHAAVLEACSFSCKVKIFKPL